MDFCTRVRRALSPILPAPTCRVQPPLKRTRQRRQPAQTTPRRSVRLANGVDRGSAVTKQQQVIIRKLWRTRGIRLGMKHFKHTFACSTTRSMTDRLRPSSPSLDGSRRHPHCKRTWTRWRGERRLSPLSADSVGFSHGFTTTQADCVERRWTKQPCEA